jgi:hypothetical protein
MPEVSVIICGRNPRPEFIRRTIAGFGDANAWGIRGVVGPDGNIARERGR